MEEDRLNDVREIFFAEPAEREAGQGDAKPACGEIGVEMRGDVAGKFRAAHALVDQGVELTAADFDDREFRSDEKAIQEDEKQNDGELQEDDEGGIPVRRRRF